MIANTHELLREILAELRGLRAGLIAARTEQQADKVPARVYPAMAGPVPPKEAA